MPTLGEWKKKKVMSFISGPGKGKRGKSELVQFPYCLQGERVLLSHFNFLPKGEGKKRAFCLSFFCSRGKKKAAFTLTRGKEG